MSKCVRKERRKETYRIEEVPPESRLIITSKWVTATNSIDQNQDGASVP